MAPCLRQVLRSTSVCSERNSDAELAATPATSPCGVRVVSRRSPRQCPQRARSNLVSQLALCALRRFGLRLAAAVSDVLGNCTNAASQLCESQSATLMVASQKPVSMPPSSDCAQLDGTRGVSAVKSRSIRLQPAKLACWSGALLRLACASSKGLVRSQLDSIQILGCHWSPKRPQTLY